MSSLTTRTLSTSANLFNSASITGIQRKTGLLSVSPARVGQLSCRRGRLFAVEDDREGSSSKKKFLTREEEPEEYWQTAGEREGKNPMKDPLAIIGIVAIFTPLIILGVAAGVGYVDLTP